MKSEDEDFLLLLTDLFTLLIQYWDPAKFGMLKIENETKQAFCQTQIVRGTKS